MRRAKPSKYRNVPTFVDGHRFASKKEARRFKELKLLERANEIVGLVIHPRYEIKVNGVKICDYVADFGYELASPDPDYSFRPIIEDVKGVRTSTYRLKANLMKALYGITIKET